MSKPSGGRGARFSGAMDAAAAALNASIHFDRRLLRDDVRGSQAHARMLATAGLITAEDADAIVAGLDRVADEFNDLHPITRATKAHFRLLSAYPWTKNSGKVARLLMNFILIRHGYLPAVIHSIERQRYYEVLRFENDGLLNLVVESLENSIETTAKFLDELNGLRVKRAS